MDDVTALLDRLATIPVPNAAMVFREPSELGGYLETLEGVVCECIGASRDGHPLFGLRFGEGPHRVSIVAGCHADEPVGPLTAQALPSFLPRFLPEILTRFTFHVVPQMNPDGAMRNRAWFGAASDFVAFVNGAIREQPGDDIEFGFGEGGGVRPECRAVRTFLESGAPYAAHCSLHGMPYAEGAWFLLCREWASRGLGIMDDLTGLCDVLGFPLHDIDRHGEKGFTRIRRGFCTSPTSDAMRRFFLEQGDSAMAAKFLPSSMEMIRAFGGDPLCTVSEIPLFCIGKRSPSPDESCFQQLRSDLDSLRTRDELGSRPAIEELVAAYQVTPVPMAMQIRLQLAMIVIVVRHTLRQ